MRWLVVMVSAVLISTASLAVEPDEVLGDPALEARAREISKGLRCVVCRNQSIDDSDAGIAKDLRVIVRERLTEGDSDAEVLDFVTARYGDYVLLRPRFTLQSALLYLGGPLLLILGGIGFWRMMRNSQPFENKDKITSLSEEERQRVNALMGEDPGS